MTSLKCIQRKMCSRMTLNDYVVIFFYFLNVYLLDLIETQLIYVWINNNIRWAFWVTTRKQFTEKFSLSHSLFELKNTEGFLVEIYREAD